MALNPATSYAGQVVTGEAGYPHGRAKNVSAPGAGDGFPLEEAWVNDLLGFEQALLAAVGVAPSGAPDAVGASQYLEALRELTRRPCIQLDVSGSPNNLELCTLATDFGSVDHGFTVIDGGGLPDDPGVGLQAGAPSNAIYIATFTGLVNRLDAADPAGVTIRMQCAALFIDMFTTRYSANTLEPVQISGSMQILMGALGQNLLLQNRSGNQITVSSGKLSVHRISRGASGW